MKTLAGYAILYDADCPICNLYSRAAVKAGLLDGDAPMPYQQAAEACPYVDRQRAVNEVALVNLKTGEVEYGIGSVLKMAGVAMPLLKPLFAFKPFVWLMSKLYAFISYNRRVIAPPKVNSGGLQPTFKPGYRLVWLLLASIIAGVVLTRYAPLVGGAVPVGPAWREYAICGGQVLFQGLIISLAAPAKRLEYLGNMCTISLVGALGLLPIVLLAHVLALPLWLCLGYFGLTALLMLLEHLRRCRLMGLNWVPSATWVLYRLLVLGVILIL